MPTHGYIWLVCFVNSNPPTDHQFVSIRTAADRLGIHPETLRRWDRKGLIPAYRTPTGIRRFLAADLDDFLEAQTA